jgi:hypothetical protein
MILPASYANGFAPRDGRPLYPELWRGCVFAAAPCLGPSGLTLRDWSGFGNHGTLTNMDAAGDWVASQGRYALDFDASNDYAATNCPRPNQSFGVSIWYQARAFDNRALFGDNAAFDPNEWFVRINATNSINLGYGGSSNSFSTTTTVNTWTHFAAWFEAGVSITVWHAGLNLGTAANAGTPPSGRTIAIGSRRQGTLQTWDGLLDDVSVINKKPTDNEIRIRAMRRGIAYEMAPRRRASVQVAGFNRRRRLLIGAGS